MMSLPDQQGAQPSTAAVVAHAPTPPADAERPAEGKGLASLFEGNPYFSAGFGLMLFGGALAYVRNVARFGADAAQRRLLVSLEIPSKDRAHPWFLHWMGAQAQAQAMRRKANDGKLPRETMLEFLGLTAPRAPDTAEHGAASANNPLRVAGSENAVSPVRIISRELAVDTLYEERNGQSDRGDATFSLVPGPGTHWFRYKGVWVRVRRSALKRD